MAGAKGNQYAKGNKGGGRKTLVEELVRRDVIERSWGRILDKFNKKNKTREDEIYLDQVSLKIAEKTIPQVIKGDENAPITIKIISYGGGDST